MRGNKRDGKNITSQLCVTCYFIVSTLTHHNIAKSVLLILCVILTLTGGKYDSSVSQVNEESPVGGRERGAEEGRQEGKRECSAARKVK